jgi:hypothetical protein
MPTICYTISFGVLLIAGLLLIIFGFEILESSLVVFASTVIPLSLSVGLIWEYIPDYQIAYLIFALAGLCLVIITRMLASRLVATLVLALVHGTAGMIIFLLPFVVVWQGKASAGFMLVGLGGGLMGLGGLLLSFLKTGKPILSYQVIFSILPGLLLLTAAAFAAGFGLS